MKSVGMQVDGDGGAGGGDGLNGADDVVVKVIGEPGIGLARPDNFDWPTRLRALAADFPPDVLVFSVGSNDAQDLTDAAGDVVVPMSDEQAWDAEYSRRLAEVFDAFLALSQLPMNPITKQHVRESLRYATLSATGRPRYASLEAKRILDTGSSDRSSKSTLFR